MPVRLPLLAASVAMFVLVLPTAVPATVPAQDDQQVSAALAAYAARAEAAYAAAVDAAQEFSLATDHFLSTPTEATLGQAREAWLRARVAYGLTEVFRFCGGPIDGIHPHTGVHGPEGRINAWPVDEAHLDYVAGDPHAGLIQDLGTPVDAEVLTARHGEADENQVTLGYHAIEFLLWGQDTDAAGPGRRPPTDYLPGDPVRERRRLCLGLLCTLLLDDLASVAVEWQDVPGSYRRYFLDEVAPSEALARALSGAATLAGFEVASERIGVPLATSAQEDEHSCFSDTTHHDLAANLTGLSLVLASTPPRSGASSGSGTLAVAGPGLLDGCTGRAEDAVRRARLRLGRIAEFGERLPQPFDQVLVAPASDPRRAELQALAGELIGLAGELRAIGEAYGVRVVIGG